jgi:uncharacterized membrane protein YkvA (DUF1232 family)
MRRVARDERADGRADTLLRDIVRSREERAEGGVQRPSSMSLVDEFLVNVVSLVLAVLAACFVSKAFAAVGRRKAWHDFWSFPWDLAAFVLRLRGDRRVHRRTWGLIVFAALYWVSPVDVMPTVIPGPPLFDDFLVAVVSFRLAMSAIPEPVRRERCPRDAVLLRRYLRA